MYLASETVTRVFESKIRYMNIWKFIHISDIVKFGVALDYLKLWLAIGQSVNQKIEKINRS